MPRIVATGQDKTLREIVSGNDIGRYEQSVTLNQVEVMRDRKFFFTGVSEPNKPGCVQVIAYPWDKIFTVQAHAQKVERLRISYDNQYLYSAGMDGSLCVY